MAGGGNANQIAPYGRSREEARGNLWDPVGSHRACAERVVKDNEALLWHSTRVPQNSQLHRQHVPCAVSVLCMDGRQKLSAANLTRLICHFGIFLVFSSFS